MEFQVFGAGRVERRREFVDLASEPIRLRLVDADSTEDKLLLADVPRRAGIIKVQQVHKKSSRVDSRPADRNAALSTAIRVYHRFPERDCNHNRENGPVEVACKEGQGDDSSKWKPILKVLPFA